MPKLKDIWVLSVGLEVSVFFLHGVLDVREEAAPEVARYDLELLVLALELLEELLRVRRLPQVLVAVLRDVPELYRVSAARPYLARTSDTSCARFPLRSARGTRGRT